MKRFFFLAVLTSSAVLAQAPEVPVILTIDVENYVQYRGDVLDTTRVAKDPNPTTALVLTFLENIHIGDIVAVNGKPAKGLWQSHHVIAPFRVNPAPGQPIADLDSGAGAHCVWEILASDGSYIGTLMDGGGGTGHALMAGLGAFVGVTGVKKGETLVPSRSASTSEDPSQRRINGGGKMRATFYIYPAFRPGVQVTASGPAVFHSDFSQVTAANPARPGEILILGATGLGPVKPDLAPPGAVEFSSSPLQEVNAPVTVSFNGKELPVTNKIGWPGQKTLYRVDFQVPSDAIFGTATLQLIAAWIPGPVVTIPVSAR